MQNSWLVSKLTTFLVEGIFKQTLTHSQPVFHLDKPGCWFLLAKCLKKHLWKSDILSKGALYHRYFLAYFTSKNQLSGFFMCGTLTGNEFSQILNTLCIY